LPLVDKSIIWLKFSTFALVIEDLGCPQIHKLSAKIIPDSAATLHGVDLKPE
jgi:hypothetical protein